MQIHDLQRPGSARELQITSLQATLKWMHGLAKKENQYLFVNSRKT